MYSILIQLIRCPIDDERVAADQWNMPLDLMVVSDGIREYCDFEIIDGTLLDIDVIMSRINSTADCVGFTYSALSSASLKKLIKIAKANGSFVIVGGQPAAAAASSLVREDDIDAVCIGDGQPTMKSISEQLVYSGQISHSKIPNILYEHNGHIYSTFSARENISEQTIPYCNRGGIDPRDYLINYPYTNTLVNMSGKIAANIFSKRGCTRHCSFCARQDKLFRTRRPNLVANEIKYLADEFDVDYILDTSDTWYDEEWCHAFSRVRNESRSDHIHMMVFADVRDITRTSADLIRECGVNSVLLGIESGSERILHRNGKSMSRNEIIEAVDILVNKEILVSCSFVLGLLGEDEESLGETIDLVRLLHNRPGVLCYGNVIMPLRGSWLWDAVFKDNDHWPSYIARALDYDLQYARELFIEVGTNIDGGVKTLTSACNDILNMSRLPEKEYAR